MDSRESSEAPNTAELLAEVGRRRAGRQAVASKGQRKAVILVDRFVFWLSKHWLAVFNTLAFIYVGLPFLAPVLMALGIERGGLIIHTMYRPMCHQLPQRSWFLFGPQIAYELPELVERVGTGLIPGPWTSSFVGNEAVGYKVALCQRDTAIYGMILITGLVLGLLRRRGPLRPLPWWAYLIFGVLPMGIDGGFQLLSYVLAALWPEGSIVPYETTPLMRAITGSLFGIATAWLAYPYIQETMDEFRETLHLRFGWE